MDSNHDKTNKNVILACDYTEFGSARGGGVCPRATSLDTFELSVRLVASAYCQTGSACTAPYDGNVDDQSPVESQE